MNFAGIDAGTERATRWRYEGTGCRHQCKGAWLAFADRATFSRVARREYPYGLSNHRVDTAPRPPIESSAGSPHRGKAKSVECTGGVYSTTTGIFPIRACHSRGPVLCTEVPALSTATVTGMSCTSNS